MTKPEIKLFFDYDQALWFIDPTWIQYDLYAQDDNKFAIMRWLENNLTRNAAIRPQGYSDSRYWAVCFESQADMLNFATYAKLADWNEPDESNLSDADCEFEDEELGTEAQVELDKLEHEFLVNIINSWSK